MQPAEFTKTDENTLRNAVINYVTHLMDEYGNDKDDLYQDAPPKTKAMVNKQLENEIREIKEIDLSSAEGRAQIMIRIHNLHKPHDADTIESQMKNSLDIMRNNVPEETLKQIENMNAARLAILPELTGDLQASYDFAMEIAESYNIHNEMEESYLKDTPLYQQTIKAIETQKEAPDTSGTPPASAPAINN